MANCGCVSVPVGCLFRLPGTCVYYSGSNITNIPVNTGDTFNTFVQNITDFVTECCEGSDDVVTIEYNATGICADSFDVNPLVTVTLLGQTGQGAYFLAVDAAVSSTFNLPTGLTGNFIAYGSGLSVDFIRVTMRNSSNATLDTFLIDNITNYGSGAVFDIAQLDNILFGCTSGE